MINSNCICSIWSLITSSALVQLAVLTAVFLLVVDISFESHKILPIWATSILAFYGFHIINSELVSKTGPVGIVVEFFVGVVFFVFAVLTTADISVSRDQADITETKE